MLQNSNPHLRILGLEEFLLWHGKSVLINPAFCGYSENGVMVEEYESSLDSTRCIRVGDFVVCDLKKGVQRDTIMMRIQEAVRISPRRFLKINYCSACPHIKDCPFSKMMAFEKESLCSIMRRWRAAYQFDKEELTHIGLDSKDAARVCFLEEEHHPNKIAAGASWAPISALEVYRNEFSQVWAQ